jgi:hypothetical protein
MTIPVLLMLLLAACGGNNDTIWTGLSGVLLFGIVAVIVTHVIKKRSK